MKFALVIAGALSLMAAPAAMAANANHPFQNCDKKVDNCGPTGDNQVDQLNAQQLGQSGGTAPMPGAPMPGAPMTGSAMSGAPMPGAAMGNTMPAPASR